MEQSMDIDQHVALFRADMFNNKTDERKFMFEDELRKKIKEQRAHNHQHTEEQRQLIQKNYQKKLDDDRELEYKRNDLNFSSLQDKKQEIRNEFNVKLRDMRRQLEREFDDKQAKIIEKSNAHVRDQKNKRKAQMARGQESKYKRVDEQIQNCKNEAQLDLQNYELDKDQELLRKKQEIDRKIKNEWLEKRREYERQEEDNRYDHQSIIKEIKDSKQKVRFLQKIHDEKQRALRQLEKDRENLKHVKSEKVKQRGEVQMNQKNVRDERVVELENEVQELKDKLEGLEDRVSTQDKRRHFEPRSSVNKFSSYQQQSRESKPADFEQLQAV